MKIIVIRHSIRNRGGDKLVLDYCNFLVGKGHDVVCWTNEVSTHLAINPRIKIRQIPHPQVKGTLRFALSTKFDAADVVLVDLVILAVCASVPNGKKVVYLAQDDDRTYYASRMVRLAIRTLYWVAFSVFRVRTIAVSEHLAKTLEVLTKGSIAVVPNGIDHHRFYRNAHSPYASEKKSAAVIVLYARSDFRKGLDIGIKAVEELVRLRGGADWELWVIGDHATPIAIGGIKMKRWGFLTGDALRDLLSVADIYLSPSRHEGFGLMQLEAMACGNVMVTTRGFPLVTDGLNGLVNPVDDWRGLARNLDRVLGNDELLCRLRRNGYALAKRYCLDRSCLLFEETLQKYRCTPTLEGQV